MLTKLKLSGLIFVSFFPALLILFSFTQTSQAVSPVSSSYITKLCEVSAAGDIAWPESNGNCLPSANTIVPKQLPSDFKALCLAFSVSGNQDVIFNAVTTAGRISCDDYSSDTDNYSDVTLVNRSEISGTPPASVSDPIKGIPPKTNPPTVKPPTTKPPTSGTAGTGDCPDGFTSKGPLCIPSNPFDSGNCDGVVCKTTVGELAATVISILLAMSGIVAVIMIIIGGYLFMTARGDETQAKNGRKTLTNALIGLAIIVVSYAVVQAVTNYLIKGST